MRMHAHVYNEVVSALHVNRGTDVQLEKSQRKVTRLVEVLDAIKVS